MSIFRLSLCASSAALLTTLCTAQLASTDIQPITGPVKQAGVYHLATNTWTRGAAAANSWDDIVYDNSCVEPGWHFSWDDVHRGVDGGRIPSTTSPENPGPAVLAISWTGTADQYTINYFEIAYCTYDPLVDIELNMWEDNQDCWGDSTLITPNATIVLPNMPSSGITGVQTCWTVGVDLANSGQSFLLLADGDGVYGGQDSFGFGWQVTSPVPGGNPGPLVGSDPLGWRGLGPTGTGCDIGANTVFYNGPHPSTQGSGLGNGNGWEADVFDPVLGTWSKQGCYWFGDYMTGNAWGNMFVRIGAEAGFGLPPGVQYCPGDGVAPHTLCPCGNNNNGGMGGCDWGNLAYPEGGVLSANGSDSYAANDTFLVANGIENNFGIFFGANDQVNSGNGNPLNDGLRCAGGGLIRLTPPTMATSNNATLPMPVQTLDTGANSGVTRRYQYWFRTPGGPCATSANLTNGYEIVWLP